MSSVAQGQPEEHQLYRRKKKPVALHHRARHGHHQLDLEGGSRGGGNIKALTSLMGLAIPVAL